jgi:DNA-binding Lrp family transcriptional regulator
VASRLTAGETAIPKIRSRTGGAAAPIDDVDRRVLNLMQGSFPLEPRPYAAVAAAAGLGEDEVLLRVQRLLDDRIIRQVTPIYDTRALGYGSMLVAAKVDPQHPWRAAKIINSHPGVSHNYLRNHEFNMWFTLAVEGDSKLGLQGTLDVLQELTGAQSIRQLPTLKLFKIRMDLEMEGDTSSRQWSSPRSPSTSRASLTTTSTARSSARRRATCRSSRSPTFRRPRASVSRSAHCSST